MKNVFKILWKVIWIALFCVILLFGTFMLLDYYGVYENALDFGVSSQEMQLFIGWVLVVIGLLFGFLPFFRIFWWLFKMAWAIAFSIILVFGVCMALDSYGVASIPFAHVANIGNWLSITLIVLGTLFGIIPFFRGWKKLFDKFKGK